MAFAFSGSLHDFLFIFDFQQFNMMHICVFILGVCICPDWSSLNLELGSGCFHLFWKILSHHVFQFFFSLLSLFFFWDFNYVYVNYLTLSHSSWMLYFAYFLFSILIFFCFSLSVFCWLIIKFTDVFFFPLCVDSSYESIKDILYLVYLFLSFSFDPLL